MCASIKEQTKRDFICQRQNVAVYSWLTFRTLRKSYLPYRKRLFADDVLLQYPVRTIADGASLQHDLHTLHRWSTSWKMAFNGKKCHVMHVTRNRNITSCSYTLGQDKLTPVSHDPYIGVELDDHLNWKEQTERARSKGVRTLNMVRCNFTR